ncbi:MAG: cell division protein ZapA [Paludibacteraceae bacterium]|jgi:cell division protein ZapA (FtsZ GTPase activity inhibitor)|nr:cell division protein ZapA [Paludibacteraceae bacterium]
MADENKLNIRLQVLGQDYPIKIDRKDEELYRKANDLISNYLAFYRKEHSGESSVENNVRYLSMTALSIAIRYLQAVENKDTTDFESEIQKLSDQLDQYCL